MGVVLVESFDAFTTVAERWIVSSPVNSPPTIGAFGRNSSNGLRWTNDHFQQVCMRVLPSAISHPRMAFAFRTSALPTAGNNRRIAAFRDGATCQCVLTLKSDGNLTIGRGNGSNDETTSTGIVLGTSSGATIVANTYFHLEWDVLIADSGGTIALYINGIQRMSVTGLDTKNTANTSCNAISCDAGGQNTTVNTDFDDVVVRDDALSGDVQVKAFFPTAVGSVNQWTASAGTTAQCVDETAPNDDTDYISEDTTSQTSAFLFDDLPSTSVVRAVAINVRAKKSGAGAGKLKPVTRISGTNYLGTEVSPSDGSYETNQDVQTNNPATSVAWSITAYNGAEFGVQRSG